MEKQKKKAYLIVAGVLLVILAVVATLNMSGSGLQGFIRLNKGAENVIPTITTPPNQTGQPPQTITPGNEHNLCLTDCDIKYPERSDSYVYCVMNCDSQFLDTDGDQIPDNLDDYPACNEPGMTRGEFFRTLYNFMKSTYNKACDLDKKIEYKDLQSSSEYYQATFCLAQWGVLGPISDSMVKPDDNISRAEASKFMAVALKDKFESNRPPSLMSFSDANNKDWYYEYLLSLNNYNLLTNVPSFRPAENANACFVKGTLNKVCANGLCEKTNKPTLVEETETKSDTQTIVAPTKTDEPLTIVLPTPNNDTQTIVTPTKTEDSPNIITLPKEKPTIKTINLIKR